MKKLLLSLAFSLTVAGGVMAQYQPSWESLDKRPTPQWWTDAKFGIFIHWGIYSVPAYGPAEGEGVYVKYSEHYMNRILEGNPFFVEHHNRYFGDKIKYEDFVTDFKAEYFEPAKWADLFVKSGAKYVVLTSKHHDGYCLWPSSLSPRWNSVAIGPHRDIAGELTKAVKDKGLRMGFYYSLLEWAHPLYSSQTIGRWADEHMIPQLKELVNKYDPEVIFSDGEWDFPAKNWGSERFLAWLYNESKVKETVVVNDRWGNDTRSKHGDYYTTEYNMIHDDKSDGKFSHPWEENRGIGGSFGYNRFENIGDYSTTKELIVLLIEKVSAGGNLLLNIGPRPDGLIPVIMQERLMEMGAWLGINGEAIYNTVRWDKATGATTVKGVYFTVKGKDLYVLCTNLDGAPIAIKGAKKGGKVSLLGSTAPVNCKASAAGLTIYPPTLAPSKMPSTHAWVYKIENAL